MFKLIDCSTVKMLTKGDFGNDFDFLIDREIIPSVSRLFAGYCGRPDFDLKARTEYFSPRSGQRVIWLSSPPVVSSPPEIPAIQLWEDGAVPRVYGSDTLLVEGEDYFCFESAGRLTKESGDYFIHGPKTVKVTYTGGYLTKDATDCPEDLKLAAAIQAKLIFDRREQLGFTGQSLEGGSVNLLVPMLLPRNVTVLLDPYRAFQGVFGGDY